LLHGIWAFKVNAAGGRTDLVFQEPRQLGLEQDFADGLVLTEWKTLTSSQGAKTRFEDARKQAQRYSVGVLAGNELTTYRYAVLVSAQQIQPPLDLREGGCVYRHINIAVDPLPPSKSRPKGA
jgi:hypothetical protein